MTESQKQEPQVTGSTLPRASTFHPCCADPRYRASCGTALTCRYAGSPSGDRLPPCSRRDNPNCSGHRVHVCRGARNCPMPSCQRHKQLGIRAVLMSLQPCHMISATNAMLARAPERQFWSPHLKGYK